MEETAEVKNATLTFWSAPVVAAAVFAAAAITLRPSSTARAETAAMPQHAIVVHGQTEPSQRVEVPSVEEGQVATIAVHEGQPVKKGQVIATLDDRVQALSVKLEKEKADSQVAIESALNQEKVARLTYQRYLQMGKVASAAETQQKKLALEEATLAVQQARENQAQRQVKLATAQAILDRMTIRSPISGSILRLAKHAGEAVKIDDTVATVVRISKLNVVFFPPEQLFGKVKVGDKVTIQVDTVPPVQRVATVIAVDPIINPASELFRVKMRLNNAQQQIAAGTAARWTWKP
jgi:HlyD family secretion protein